MRGLARDQGRVDEPPQLRELPQELADDEDPVGLVALEELPNHRELQRVLARRGGTGPSCPASSYRSRTSSRQRHAELDAAGLGDVAVLLELPPRQVVAAGPDQREDVGLLAVLAHERRREAEPAPRLELGGDAEDRRGQQVHLVVDHEAPVVLVEEREVREALLDRLPVREDLVGRDRDRLDLLDLAGVLADLVRAERRAVVQLADPLRDRGAVRREDRASASGRARSPSSRRSSCPRRRAARRRREPPRSDPSWKNARAAACW